MIGRQLYLNEHRTMLCDEDLKELKKQLFLEYRQNRPKEKKYLEAQKLLAIKGKGHLNINRIKKEVSLSLPGRIYFDLQRESNRVDDMKISEVGLLWLGKYYDNFIKNQGPVKSFI